MTMPLYASSIEDSQDILYERREFSSRLGDICAMLDDKWRVRLQAALDESGKSKRAASLEAGLGPGYMHSVLSEGKDPTIDRLLRVCEVLGVSASWIIYGVSVTPEDEAILAEMQKKPDLRDTILNLLRQAQKTY